MRARMMHFFLYSSAVLVVAAAQAASAADRPAAKAPPTPTSGTVSLICSPFYLPARSIWKREVDIAYDADGVYAVKIDGLAVYSFAVTDTTLLTAVDGERIQIDTATRTWSSDLRGLVTSSGACTAAS